jgi:hypothetical protein
MVISIIAKYVEFTFLQMMRWEENEEVSDSVRCDYKSTDPIYFKFKLMLRFLF